MLRLGRRGIILSLFVNSLNIALYLIILIASCLNIIEASVNFIILNVFAAFGCLIASPIPFNLYGGIIVVCMGLAFVMLSYVSLIPPLDGLILNYKKLDQWKEQKHFRVQLEAQRIYEQQLQQEQNLTRMIPAHHPNSMTVHAHMVMGSPKQIRAFSAINAGSSLFNGVGGSNGHEGTGNGGNSGVALTAMFSPPISPSRQTTCQLPLSATPFPGQQQYKEQEVHFPKHQPQSKLHGSVSNFTQSGATEGYQTIQVTTASQDNLPTAHNHYDLLKYTLHDRAATTRSKSRHPLQQQQSISPSDESITIMDGVGRNRMQSISGNNNIQEKIFSPIVTEMEAKYAQHQTSTPPSAFPLSPPSTQRRGNNNSAPGSPLQYLCINNDDSTTVSSQAGDFDILVEESTPIFSTVAPIIPAGDKPELKNEIEHGTVSDISVPKSSSQYHAHPSFLGRQNGSNVSRRSDQQHYHHLPLRTANKPTPPHDPFRKTSLSGASRVPSQSLYQPPEPSCQTDMTSYQLSQQPTRNYQESKIYSGVPTMPGAIAPRISPMVSVGGPGTIAVAGGGIGTGAGGGSIAMTATGRILSSIGGMSGCYGIIGGVPQSVLMTGTPGISSITNPATYSGSSLRRSRHSPSKLRQQLEQQQQRQQQLEKEQQLSQHERSQPQLCQPQQSPSSGAHSNSNIVHQDNLYLQPIPATTSNPPVATTDTMTATKSPRTQRTSPNHKKFGHRKAVNFQPSRAISPANVLGQETAENVPKQQQQIMPDIVLTLPTPADTSQIVRKEEYFAM
ncbi:hypothetical protein FBU30_002443 [Linnemannia zychae]|nr:hypothetical protein FBU30_002443 [Linnemannia zychae]